MLLASFRFVSCRFVLFSFVTITKHFTHKHKKSRSRNDIRNATSPPKNKQADILYSDQSIRLGCATPPTALPLPRPHSHVHTRSPPRPPCPLRRRAITTTQTAAIITTPTPTPTRSPATTATPTKAPGRILSRSTSSSLPPKPAMVAAAAAPATGRLLRRCLHRV